MPEDCTAPADQLRRQFEALAMQLVMSSGLEAPETLRALWEALSQVCQQAEEAGRAEVAELARELAAPVGEACGGAQCDLAALEQALRQGVQQLQRAVEAGPAVDKAAQQGGWQKSLAQDPELVHDVILECREHLSAVEAGLLKLEQDPSDSEALHAVFRSFHTIKGLAGFMEFTAVQEVAHELETILDLARNGQLLVTPAVTDVVLAGKDYLAAAIGAVEAALAGRPAELVGDNRPLLERVRAVGRQSEAAAAQAPTAGPAAPSEPRDVSAPWAAAEESQAAGGPAEDNKAKAGGERLEARVVKVDTAKLDYLVDMAGEMVVAQSLVRHDPVLATVDSPRLQRNLAQLARITNELQRTAMAMRMVPIAQLFRRMPRLVRDLSRKAGKQVELELEGEDTELDRTIVEELADPLIHMVRNSLDHGIETPEERRAAGKNPVGQLQLKARHQAGHIVVEVTDDGRGIDRRKVLKKAQERGLVAEEAHLSEAEIFDLIFTPGFSTAERVTDVSGRGVGMDVVRQHLQKLRGRVEVRSELGSGTSFFLKLPLTLAIIEGLVVSVGRERYIVPLFSVRETFRPTPEMISTVHGRDEMVLVRGRLLPVVRLDRKFAVQPRSENLCDCILILTENEGRPFCLAVDEFVGKQEVVIKSLGEALKSVEGIAGGAILGDGRVGLVLNMDGLFAQRGNAGSA